MKIRVERKDFGPDYTGGKLYVNGEYFCDTIEDTDRYLEDGGEKQYGKTAIPRGTYNSVIDFSGRFQRELPRVLDVPDFTGVRIHPGNDSTDTEGCILVGKNQHGNWVSDSRSTFARLFAVMEDAYDRNESLEIEIV